MLLERAAFPGPSRGAFANSSIHAITMASNDVRDVLNLPSEHTGPRPAKKQKTSSARPNLKGLAREVQNLGGDNPIAIVPEVSFFKKRRLANKPAAKWELRPFTNSAREDDGGLVLRHWRRKTAARISYVLILRENLRRMERTSRKKQK